MFDPIKWINKYYGAPHSVDYAYLKDVLCFTLIWNIFESELCNKEANFVSIKKGFDKYAKDSTVKPANYLEFACEYRVWLQGTTCDKLFYDRKLSKIENSIWEEIHNFIKSTGCTQSDILTMLYISFRLRNNLFHGNKEVSRLYVFVDLFDVTNRLLSRILDDTRGRRFAILNAAAAEATNEAIELIQNKGGRVPTPL